MENTFALPIFSIETPIERVLEFFMNRLNICPTDQETNDTIDWFLNQAVGSRAVDNLEESDLFFHQKVKTADGSIQEMRLSKTTGKIVMRRPCNDLLHVADVLCSMSGMNLQN